MKKNPSGVSMVLRDAGSKRYAWPPSRVREDFRP